MSDPKNPPDMTADEIRNELRDLGVAVRGNPKKQTLVDQLAKARAGEAVSGGDGGDEKNPAEDRADEAAPGGDEARPPETPAAAGTMFIKTVPLRNYVLVLEPAKYVRDADGRPIDKTPGHRVRFDESGRFATADAALIERIKASKAFMNRDPRVRIEIFDPKRKAGELRAAAARLEGL